MSPPAASEDAAHLRKSPESGAPVATTPVANHKLGETFTIAERTLRRIQPKLAISRPGDAHELEADQIAEEVMSMPETSAPPAIRGGAAPRVPRAELEDGWADGIEPSGLVDSRADAMTLQRNCDGCEGGAPCKECDEEAKGEQSVQRKVAGAADKPNVSPEENFVESAGPGFPMDQTAREFLEPRFGYDFGQVRIHTGTRAAESARCVNALAYTVGRDVVFGENKYAPGAEEGRRLLAHEVTHVIQQGGASPAKRRSVAPALPLDVADPDAEDQPTPALQSHVDPRPPSLSRSVIVDPPAAVSEVLTHFNNMCSAGNFAASGASITQNCTSSSSQSCDCLCDVAGDATRTYTIKVVTASATTQNTTLHDGTPAVIPDTTAFPSTNVGPNPSITMTSVSSGVEFGEFNPTGAAQWVDPWRILAHELCGHARLNQLQGGVRGDRPGHDVTIDTENAIAAEQGGPARGHYGDTRQGESFFNPVGSRSQIVFFQKQGPTDVNGTHFDPP